MERMFDRCSKLTTIGPVDIVPGWQHTPTHYKHMCPTTLAPKPSWYK